MNAFCTYDQETLTCTTCGHVAKLLPTYRRCKPPPPPIVPATKPPPGPGHFLTKTLGYVGIHYTEDCDCKPMAAKMDSLGPDWCESPDGMKEILDTMRREHAKRKMLIPWSDLAASGLILAASALARRHAAR